MLTKKQTFWEDLLGSGDFDRKSWRLVYEWVAFSRKFGIYVYVYFHILAVRPYPNQIWVPQVILFNFFGIEFFHKGWISQAWWR